MDVAACGPGTWGRPRKAAQTAPQICAALGRDLTGEERARHLPGLSDNPVCAGIVGERAGSRGAD